METEEYQGFRIEHEPDTRTGPEGRDHWFNVSDASGLAFRLRMRVHWSYAVVLGAPEHPRDATVRLSRELGLRWTHGLIDLGFERGNTYEEGRSEAWNPLFADADVGDADLRFHLLRALRSMLRAEALMSSIPELDIEGVSDVLGVRPERTRATLNELSLEGLVEGRAETFGRTLVDGACRITGNGLQELRRLQSERDASNESPRPEPQASRDFGGRWRVVRSLGEGGQAHTFIVRDLTTGSEDWVLKRLKNRNRLGRFEREIEALQRLDSSRIPTIVDYSVGEPAYIVSRFAGDTLSNLNLATMPMAERLSLFANMVEAIRDAHGAGVVHRDIKPNNVVVGAGGAFVFDFGICQIIDDSLILTTVDEAFGNPAFAAPECGQGSDVDCGPPSDVYSLGKVLYWMVSNGRFIVRERFDHETENLIDDSDPWVRRYVSTLIRGCVSEDAGHRWLPDALAARVVDVLGLIVARAESAARNSIAVWDGFWLGNSFNESGTRSATQPDRGNPPAVGDVASSFTVEVGGEFELRELVLAVTHRAGVRRLEVSICDDLDGSPSEDPPLERYRATIDEGTHPQFLRLVSEGRPRLREGQRYWVVLSVPEPDTEIAWFSAAQELSGVFTRIAERFDNGRWQAAETRGGFAFRVIGAR